MALTPDGKLLLVANNAEDPPYGTLLAANGDRNFSAVHTITKITVDPAIMPPGFGLSLEQSTWERKTKRFYLSIPIIANNPTDCNYGQLAGDITCHGGLAVIDPTTLTAPFAVLGAFDPATNTGVVMLNECGPNGATVGPHSNLLLGCTPQNNPSDTSTLVINAKTKHFANIGGLTGSDEVWFNAGDRRYYTGSSRACGLAAGCPAPKGGAALGVIDGETNLLIETIPQSQNSHSVAADAKRNRIYVPQVAPVAVVGSGGDSTTVGAGICGSNYGCVAVYRHDVDGDEDGDDHDRDDDRDRR
jgi:DNA-binding beta-propeller fold protein YncE